MAIAAALAAGLAIGLVNGFFVLYFRMNSLIVTMGVGTFVHGLTLWLGDQQTISGVSEGLVDAVIVRSFSRRAAGILLRADPVRDSLVHSLVFDSRAQAALRRPGTGSREAQRHRGRSGSPRRFCLLQG